MAKKETTLAKKEKTRTTTDKIIRISLDNYNRLQKIKRLGGKDHSYNAVVDSMLQVAELAAKNGTLYILAGHVYETPEDARGEALLIAKKLGVPVDQLKVRSAVVLEVCDAGSI